MTTKRKPTRKPGAVELAGTLGALESVAAVVASQARLLALYIEHGEGSTAQAKELRRQLRGSIALLAEGCKAAQEALGGAGER